MFEYHCNFCRYDFFTEEGYDSNLNAIVCPVCGVIRYGDVDNYIIKETLH